MQIGVFRFMCCAYCSCWSLNPMNKITFDKLWRLALTVCQCTASIYISICLELIMFSPCSWWKQMYNYYLLPLRTEFSQCGTSAFVLIFFNIIFNKEFFCFFFFLNLQLLRLFYNSFMAHRHAKDSWWQTLLKYIECMVIERTHQHLHLKFSACIWEIQP